MSAILVRVGELTKLFDFVNDSHCHLISNTIYVGWLNVVLLSLNQRSFI